MRKDNDKIFPNVNSQENSLEKWPLAIAKQNKFKKTMEKPIPCNGNRRSALISKANGNRDKAKVIGNYVMYFLRTVCQIINLTKQI